MATNSKENKNDFFHHTSNSETYLLLIDKYDWTQLTSERLIRIRSAWLHRHLGMGAPLMRLKQDLVFSGRRFR